MVGWAFHSKQNRLEGWRLVCTTKMMATLWMEPRTARFFGLGSIWGGAGQEGNHFCSRAVVVYSFFLPYGIMPDDAGKTEKVRRSRRNSSAACRLLRTDNIRMICEAHRVAPTKGRGRRHGLGEITTNPVKKEKCQDQVCCCFYSCSCGLCVLCICF